MESSSTEPNSATADQMDAINRVFVELELAYHNQFHKAFSREDNVTLAKQLWLDTLRLYTPEVLIRAGRAAIAASEYLPSLHNIQKHCLEQMQVLGIPDANSAFREACNAPSPKRNFAWSHPLVYHAGLASDWFFLANNPENKTFPIFFQHYQHFCQRVLNGEEFQVEAQPALADEVQGPKLSKEERLKKLRELRKVSGV
ncbi:MAG: replication protein P [Pseudomonadales bacterium]